MIQSGAFRGAGAGPLHAALTWRATKTFDVNPLAKAICGHMVGSFRTIQFGNPQHFRGSVCRAAALARASASSQSPQGDATYSRVSSSISVKTDFARHPFNRSGLPRAGARRQPTSELRKSGHAAARHPEPMKMMAQAKVIA
jgi:hypothetical protein